MTKPRYWQNLCGHWVLNSHFATERGELPVYKDQDGIWRSDVAICVWRVLFRTDEPEIVITGGEDDNNRPFLPDPGEIERLGIPIDVDDFPDV